MSRPNPLNNATRKAEAAVRAKSEECSDVDLSNQLASLSEEVPRHARKAVVDGLNEAVGDATKSERPPAV